MKTVFYYHGCGRGVVYVKETLKASRGFDFLSFVVARMDGGYGKTCFVALAASWMQVGCKNGLYCTLHEWSFLSSVPSYFSVTSGIVQSDITVALYNTTLQPSDPPCSRRQASPFPPVRQALSHTFPPARHSRPPHHQKYPCT